MNLMNAKTLEIALGLLAAILLFAASSRPELSAPVPANGYRATCHWQRPLLKNGAMPVHVPGCPKQGLL
jgi:hypothetical protein